MIESADGQSRACVVCPPDAQVSVTIPSWMGIDIYAENIGRESGSDENLKTSLISPLFPTNDNCNMPIPKQLVREREDSSMIIDSADDQDDGSMTRRIAEEVLASRARGLLPRNVASNKKKGLSVRWKDIEDGGVDEREDGDDSSMSSLASRRNPPPTKHIVVRKRSPSPPVPLTTKELEDHIRRQEASIRRACKLELKLLNQSKKVREKRVRMVERLRRLKRKARKSAVNKINSNNFVAPPVFSPSSKKATIIDITATECAVRDRLLSA